VLFSEEKSYIFALDATGDVGKSDLACTSSLTFENIFFTS
jgi:hypothetical protein